MNDFIKAWRQASEGRISPASVIPLATPKDVASTDGGVPVWREGTRLVRDVYQLLTNEDVRSGKTQRAQQMIKDTLTRRVATSLGNITTAELPHVTDFDFLTVDYCGEDELALSIWINDGTGAYPQHRLNVSRLLDGQAYDSQIEHFHLSEVIAVYMLGYILNDWPGDDLIREECALRDQILEIEENHESMLFHKLGFNEPVPQFNPKAYAFNWRSFLKEQGNIE